MSTEYGKIETLYERGDNFKVKVGEFKNRTYSLLKTWNWTEKVDGTNIRCIWAGDGSLVFNGRTDNANVPGDLLKYLQETIIADQLNTMFSGTPAVIYGEGYGAGIQKGGGEYSSTKKFIVFDVLVDNKWWLNYEQVTDIATKLGLPVVPNFGEMTLEEATELVSKGFLSRCSEKMHVAEGLVGRPLETLFDKKGHRLITKLKTKDF